MSKRAENIAQVEERLPSKLEKTLGFFGSLSTAKNK
jgi:hypothetical protein